MKTIMKRSTVYLDPKIHRALKIKSIHSSKTMSELINEAIRLSLSEDYEDLSAFDERKNEPNLDFESVLKELQSSGKL